MAQSAAEDIRSYDEAGVDAIELCETKFPDSKSERLELVARLKDTRIRPVSVQPTVHSVFPDRMASEPREPKDRLDAFKASVDFWTDALETPNLPFVLIAGVAPEQNFRDGWRLMPAFVKVAARFAESRGVRIAFEPLGPNMMYFDTFVFGLDQGRRLLDMAESESVGLVIDAWHLWEEHRLETRLEGLADHVFVVHVCDYPASHPRGLDDRVVPGDGVIPLKEKFYEPLRNGGYDGPFIFELLSDQSLPDSLWNEEPGSLLARLKRVSDQFPKPRAPR
ncbi:sugar phosphate isomerase/epimerase family protein [Pelagicoccus sp. SDUM812002]|uniref:sugar phosphate isomerase/epimerase family protein n=1 Tax=Pelagicoccus sp. SDUM812002 TaxID=3041266 RepID=UPI0028121F3E|nr:sugar phosphate isomerase/epimerase family protein [Pelagicoccus sp. SDUM812002]